MTSPEQSDNSTQPKMSEREVERTVGLFFLVAGLALGAYSIAWPLYQAHQAVPELKLSMKLSVSAVFMLVFAIAELLGIKFFSKLFEDNKHLGFVDILRLIVLVAIGGGAWWAFKTHIESLGYQFPM